MQSVRRFIGLWLVFTAAIIAYAFADLSMNPWLQQENGLSLEPDFERIGEVVHWGGRVLRESQAALVANAVVMGGVLSLLALALVGLFRRDARREPERISVYPAGIRQSVPPSVN